MTLYVCGSKKAIYLVVLQLSRSHQERDQSSRRKQEKEDAETNRAKPPVEMQRAMSYNGKKGALAGCVVTDRVWV